MPESIAVQELKHRVGDSIGLISNRLLAEDAGINALLSEGRQSAFNLKVTNTDGQTVISAANPFGKAETISRSRLSHFSADSDLDGDNDAIKFKFDTKTSFTDAKSPNSAQTGAEETHFETDFPLDLLLSTGSRATMPLKLDDTMKDGDGKIVIKQAGDCLTNLDMQFKTFDALCNGKLTTAAGVEYDFVRKANQADSRITISSEGKEIGTVFTYNDQKPATTFIVTVRPHT